MIDAELDQPLCKSLSFSSCAAYEFEDRHNFYQCTACHHAIEGCDACGYDADNNLICNTCKPGL